MQLGFFVVRSLNDGFSKGELSTTQKEVIVCIPEGDKPKDLIKNWRPVSLFNVVYKIGTACIAKSLKSVLRSLSMRTKLGLWPTDTLEITFD